MSCQRFLPQRGPQYTWDPPIPVYKRPAQPDASKEYPLCVKQDAVVQKVQAYCEQYEISSADECQSKADLNSKKPQTSEASTQSPVRSGPGELQCWASKYTSSHLQKLRNEAGGLQTKIQDLAKAVGDNENDKGVGALRVQSALLSAEVGALETVLETTANQSSEQAIWTAMQQALKKQHRIELMTLRTAAALSGHQIGMLSSSSEASDTSYASTSTSPSPEPLLPDKNSDTEAAQLSAQESTTVNDESSDSNAACSTEEVNLSSDDEDMSECSPPPTWIRSMPTTPSSPPTTWTRSMPPLSPKPVAPGELAVPLPCWAAPADPCGGSSQASPPKAESTGPAAFAAVLACNPDPSKFSDSLKEPEHQPRSDLNTMLMTTETTSEDINQMMLQMVGVRKGHQERCAATLSQMKFFEFR